MAADSKPTKKEPSHVPAWKKLGLKLKYAQDDDDGDDGRQDSVREEEEEEKEERVKGKRKGKGKKDKETEKEKSASKDRSSKKRKLDEGEDENGDADGEGDSSEKKKKDKKKRKKVDGSTSISPSVFGVKEGDDYEKMVQVSSADEKQDKGEVKDEKEDGTKKKKKEKRNKKKDSDSNLSTTTTTAKIHEAPILSYLSRYHKNRSEWKFQKAKEVHLFKQILSLEHVPAHYNAALLAYLKGLKSEGAKQRLSEAAEAAIKTDIEGKTSTNTNTDNNNAEGTTNDESSQTSPYSEAIETFRKWLPDGQEDFDGDNASEKIVDDGMRKRLERRQRAELVWFAVNDCKLFEIEKPKGNNAKKALKSAQGGGGVGGQNQSNKKKRKNRTVFVEISSSSESESESGSDSDSESTSSSDSSSSSSSSSASSS